MLESTLKIIIVVGYVLLLSAYSWAFVSGPKQVNRRYFGLFTIVVLAMTIYLTILSVSRARCPFGTSAESLYFISWILTVMFWVMDLRPAFSADDNEDRSIRIFLLPVSFTFTILALINIDTTEPTSEYLQGYFYPIHVFSILFAYVVYLLAFVSLSVYQRVLGDLKQKKTGFLFKRMPPLATLQRRVNFFLAIGCTFLPVGILFGLLWAADNNLVNPDLNRKILFSGITWILFTAAFIMHFFHLRSTRTVYFLSGIGLIVSVASFAVQSHGF